MKFALVGIGALAAYLAALAVLAEAARRARRDDSPADHFLANRELRTFVLFLTLYATAYSGNSLLGYPGEAYRRGFSWIMATGFMLAIVVLFHGLAPRLRPLAARHGFVSPGDWIAFRFQGQPGARGLRTAVGAAMTLALLNFLLAQLVAMGHVAAELSGRLLPYWAGVVGLAGVILAYETLGGMRAVAWTDALQGILMLVGLGALLGWVLSESGGLSGLTREIRAARPAAAAVPGWGECANWASSTILMAFGSVVYPQAIQRIYAAADDRTLRHSLALMSFMPLATTAVVTFVGLAAIPRFPGLGELEADAVMPRLLHEWASRGPQAALLATLVFLGALAAIMSTADSVLLSLGSVIAQDLLGRSPRDPSTTRLGKRVAMLSMAALVAVALEPRRTLWGLVELKMDILIQCAPVFFAGLHWRGLRASGALAGFAVGTAIAAAGVLAGHDRIGGIHAGVIGFAANGAVSMVVSAWLGRRGA